MPQETIFLLILFALGLLSKNQSVMVASLILLAISWTRYNDLAFAWLKGHGLNLGITIITIAVLVPIASGEIKLTDVGQAVTSPVGIILIVAGILVAMFGGMGLRFLTAEPHLTVGVILGTIVGVVAFRGIPVGPLIGAGIALTMIKLYELIVSYFA